MRQLLPFRSGQYSYLAAIDINFKKQQSVKLIFYWTFFLACAWRRCRNEWRQVMYEVVLVKEVSWNQEPVRSRYRN